MSVILRLDNFAPSNVQEKTYVESDADATDTTLTVKSAQNISTNKYALIGAPGSEDAELRLISGVTGNDLTVAALGFSHQRYAQTTILNANQIKIYRAANVDGTAPADDDFSLLATVDIDTDELQTSYTDSNGGSDYWYKYTYYNEQTTAETDIANSDVVRGGFSIYATVEQIRSEAGISNNQWITDVDVDGRRIEAQSYINSKLASIYTVPFTTISPTIRHITELLAAGYILTTEWGQGSVGTTDIGEKKIQEAKDMLDEIVAGTSPILGEDGSMIVDNSKVGGWPNSTTKDAEVEDGGSPRIFRIGDEY